jgi:hypothetical protein
MRFTKPEWLILPLGNGTSRALVESFVPLLSAAKRFSKIIWKRVVDYPQKRGYSITQ